MSLGNLDRRRVNPPSTTAPVYIEAQGDSTKTLARSDLLSARSIFVQTGLVSQASGSAYLETETIKLACAVYGPKQVKSKVYSNEAELNVDVRFASFATRRRKKAGKVRLVFLCCSSIELTLFRLFFWIGYRISISRRCREISLATFFEA